MGRPNDRPYDISVKQTWTVRAAAAIVATIQKYRINLTLLLHLLPSPFIYFYSTGLLYDARYGNRTF